MKTDPARSNCEIELSKGRKKFYIKIFFDPDEIWVELEAFGPKCFLCALFDGIPLMESLVGPKGKKKKIFANVDWLINEWGGPKEIVEALQSRKKDLEDELPRLKEKYGNVEKHV